MTTRAADVLADPVGVIVDLVAGVELALDRTAITAVVIGSRAAGPGSAASPGPGERPSVLTDGRSPALARPPGNCLSPCARQAR